MKTEIFLENNRVDIGAEESSLLTFAIAELQDFGSRQTTFSKTIVLPGTSNNNALLGNIFEIGNANEYNPLLDNIGYNFNASKSAATIIFQDNIQTFKGGLRLLQINIDRGRVEYEVAVFGDLATLNVALTSGKLEDLDFSAYDETYTEAHVLASWSNGGGSGLFYPLIDYGTYSTLKHDWDIMAFRPALYAKEYIDKMFSDAGFRYSCALFNTTRFKKLIIPHSQKQLQKVVSANFDALRSSYYNAITTGPAAATISLPDGFTADGFTIDFANEVVTYTGLITIAFDLEFTLTGDYWSASDIFFVAGGQATPFIPANGGFPSFDAPFSTTLSYSGLVLNTGDTIQLQVGIQDASIGDYEVNIATAELKLTSTSGTTPVPIALGDTIIINDTIPKNIRQIDFFVSILQLFNMYAYEDKFDDRLINIAPYVDFYSPDTSNSIDWTYKLDRDAIRQIKPMSELNSKIYNFNYKSDGDYFNDLYNKRYGQVYGGYIYDSKFEFTAESNSLELCFSPTPLVGYDGEDKIYSTIFKRTGDDVSPVEENTDCNIRLLQSKLITGVSSWDLIDNTTGSPVVLSSHTDYPYAGHFNDPDAPSDDINFGALQQLFFTLATGNLSATQFNIYWSPYMAEITDKDSKLLIASFHLTPADIFNLDFSKYVVVDGVLFRLNKIIDYNINMPSTCKVELLKVNYTTY